MGGEYKATCGCAIHVAQWTAKRKIVTQKSCPMHLAAKDMLAALKAWEHWYSGDSSEFNRDNAREDGLKAIAKAEGEARHE
jgi:hypothetical protein